jgi:hypothetical protein
VETGVVIGWVVVVGSEVALVASISVVELFEGTVDVRISDKIVDVKPLVAAVGVSLEDVSGEFIVGEWVFLGVVPDAKLFVVEISVASVDPWEECAVELFGNAADVGVVETSAALVVVKLVVVGAVVGVDMAVVDSSDDFMEVVSIVGWFVTDVGVEVAAEVSKVLVVVEMVEKASFVLGVETVVSGGEAVVDSEDVLAESISVIEIFDTLVDVRIAEVKPLVAAVGVSLENVSGEFAVVEWMFVGVVPDTKLLVDEISVASVDSWDECAVELFGNAADVGVVVGAVVGVEITVGDPSDDFMEVVTIVG